MRIAISNIAWDVSEDDNVAACLNEHGIDAIDVAPTKYFPDVAKATDQEIATLRNWWSRRGIELTGMQSLLFGTQGLNLFAEKTVQERMLAHLDAVCRIAAGLGSTRLVFGSPRNRDRGSLPDPTVKSMASEFFRKLGDIAVGHGVMICLEPNPPRYGSNFLLNADDTADMVRSVAHKGIRMQFDTGALEINGENPAKVLQDHADIIGHIHASEPGLVPLGDGETKHAGIGKLLEQALPTHVVTIEMVATQAEPHLQAIKRALPVAIAAYDTPKAGKRANP